MYSKESQDDIYIITYLAFINSDTSKYKKTQVMSKTIISLARKSSKYMYPMVQTEWTEYRRITMKEIMKITCNKSYIHILECRNNQSFKNDKVNLHQ